MSEQTITRIIFRSVVTIVLVAALAWFSWTVRSILVLILVSTILATGLSPIVDAIAGHRPQRSFLPLPRAAAALILYAGLFFAATLAVVEVIPSLVGEAEDLAMKMPGYAEEIHQHILDLEGTYPSLNGVDGWLMAQISEVLSGIGDIPTQISKVLGLAMGVVNGVFTTVLLLVFTFYLIVDAEVLSRGMLALLPPESRTTAASVADRVRVKVGGWFIGQLFLSALIGTTTFVGLRLLGVPYALFLAVVAAIGELIPMVGPILAAVPAVIVAVQISPTLGLLTVGLYVIIQQLENHVIVPQIMHRAVDLPPVVVMTALLAGNEILGVVGAIIALPVAAALSVVVGEIMTLRSKEAERQLETSREIA